MHSHFTTPQTYKTALRLSSGDRLSKLGRMHCHFFARDNGTLPQCVTTSARRSTRRHRHYCRGIKTSHPSDAVPFTCKVGCTKLIEMLRRTVFGIHCPKFGERFCVLGSGQIHTPLPVWTSFDRLRHPNAICLQEFKKIPARIGSRADSVVDSAKWLVIVHPSQWSVPDIAVP